MMNFNQINRKLSTMGYRRNAYARNLNDDNGNPMKVYDYEHRRGYDMFSVYLDENDNMLYAEFTKVTFNQETRKFSQDVTRIDSAKMLARYLH